MTTIIKCLILYLSLTLPAMAAVEVMKFPSATGVLVCTPSDPNPACTGGGGGSQTPWTSNIDGAGYNLTNVNILQTKSSTLDNSSGDAYLGGQLEVNTQQDSFNPSFGVIDKNGNYAFQVADYDAPLYNNDYVQTLNNVLDDGLGNLTAVKLITSGGTSSQFVKGDGSLDSSAYLTAVTADSPLSGSGTSASHLVISTAGTWSGNAVTATTATNIAGGAGGSIPYQTAAATTGMLANGAVGQILRSAGTTLAPIWSTPTFPNTAGNNNLMIGDGTNWKDSAVPTWNQNTTGSAASLSISGQTGLLSITGLTSTNRIKTVRDAADTILELGGSYTPTGTWNWTSASVTWPTFNQNTTGSAAKWTTARNLAGNSVDGSGNVAFANSFIVQGTTDTGLSGAQFLGALGTGIVKNTTTTGVLSIAASSDVIGLFTSCSGTQYLGADGACHNASGGAVSSVTSVAGTYDPTITPTTGAVTVAQNSYTKTLLAIEAANIGGGA